MRQKRWPAAQGRREIRGGMREVKEYRLRQWASWERNNANGRCVHSHCNRAFTAFRCTVPFDLFTNTLDFPPFPWKIARNAAGFQSFQQSKGLIITRDGTNEVMEILEFGFHGNGVFERERSQIEDKLGLFT